MVSKVRLYVDHPLGKGQSVPLGRDQANYLFNVMRLGTGAVLTLINSRDGAWDATVTEAGKRGGVLTCTALTAPLRMPPDLWLIVAPIKKSRMDLVIEKAVEMGARRILPVQTAYTNERLRIDKAQAHAIEAAEQCGATYVPEVNEPVKLGRLLADWPPGRQLMFCDESAPAGERPGDSAAAPWAILIGPEGGFSAQERQDLRALAFAHPVSLGPRILRADTAAVAAMTYWQLRYGDWSPARQGN